MRCSRGRRGTYRGRKEFNRKQKKLRWIRACNRVRKYSDCNYGEFYCDHVYDPTDPWVWVDFSFFHTRLKRYFAVAMVTAEYAAFNKAEDRAIDEAYAAIPRDESIPIFIKDKKSDNFYRFNHTEDDERRYQLLDSLRNEYLELEYKIKPGFEIKDYGPVAVGVHATVNRTYIDEHSIREFIAHFQSIGEPTKAGWKWEDEEITVVPKRFKRTKAAE